MAQNRSGRRKKRRPPRKPGTLGRDRAMLAVNRLHRELKNRGHGEIGRTEVRLLYNKGYINQIRTNGDVKLSVLYELASDLGVSVESLISADDGEAELFPRRKAPKLASIILENSACSAALPLEELDKERFRDPTAVLKVLARGGIKREQVPDALGLASSCYGQVYDFNSSLWCIDLALERNLAAGLILKRSVILEFRHFPSSLP